MATLRPMRRWCLTKASGSLPRALAETIAARASAPILTFSRSRLPGRASSIIRLKASFWPKVLDAALKLGDAYGRSTIGQGHQGQCRICLGQSDRAFACRPLPGRGFRRCARRACSSEAGYEVTKEYYINDAGAQVDVLARSAYLRYREALGEEIGEIPAGLYPGDYLKPVGRGAGCANIGKTLLNAGRERMAAARARQRRSP